MVGREVHDGDQGAPERPDHAALADHLHGLLRSRLEGRRVVLAMDILVGTVALAEVLPGFGVEDVLVVAGSRGTGELDPAYERDALVLGVSGRGIMGPIRAFESALDDPPPELRSAIDRFDPDGDALVITTLFSTRQQLCGRPVFGGRDPRWAALEDKTVVDTLWDAAGVPRSPSAIVPARQEELEVAAARLDEGLGTVWVADNREGWHGGAEYLRWVRSPHDAAPAAAALTPVADRIRVMPFLDGRPCSIHGWVLGDEVITSRPCETVALRERDAPRLRYCGAAATAWRPADEDAEAMRAVVRQVGRHLRDTVDYRGVFTVDGVLTADGFRPTELNPRFGAAIGTLGRGADLPLYTLHLLSVDAPDLDLRPAELEATIQTSPPVARAFVQLDGVDVEPRAARVLRDGPGWRVEDVEDEPRDDAGDEAAAGGHTAEGDTAEGDTAEGDTAGGGTDVVAEVELGPGPSGGFLRLALVDHPDGAAVAPVVAELLPAVADHLDLDIPAMDAAPDLRPL